MATTKSMKIQAEIDKVKAKISEQQARLKELEQKKLEAENSEIVDIVRGMSISLTELPLLFEKLKDGGTLGQSVPKWRPKGGLTPWNGWCKACAPAWKRAALWRCRSCWHGSPTVMSRFMRMLVFFDLPVQTKKQRREATAFRNFLIKDGYHMLQYSVYARVCNGNDAVTKHRARLTGQLPANGAVRLLVVTEKQYQSIEILLGPFSPADTPFACEQLTLF